MDKKKDKLFEIWRSRNIEGIFCDNKDQAVKEILGIIPLSASIGISGSVTLNQLEITRHLEERGNKVFNQYKPGISREENLKIRTQGTQADYYLASANAVSFTGEMVFFSAFGNRTCGIANARNAIIVCGTNKLAPNLGAALKRSREYSTVLNCKRLNWNTPCFKDGVCHRELCLFPEYKRMCCQVLIIEAEVTPGRLKVILVGEELGF